jgi:hypothetical protein
VLPTIKITLVAPRNKLQAYTYYKIGKKSNCYRLLSIGLELEVEYPDLKVTENADLPAWWPGPAALAVRI